MANTSTTSTVLDQSTDAAFRTWVAEIITQLTGNGLVQTADTGQINTTTATRTASANTAVGYSIFRFSDTLQATSPVFIKLEYGTGQTATISPQMFITIGQGSNGSGTLTGNLSTRCALSGGQVASSIITGYTSRFIVNMTLGYVGLAWKLGGAGVNVCQGGFVLFRSNDTSGSPTGDSINLITNAIGATGSNSSTGIYNGYSYLTTQWMPINGAPTVAQNGAWLGTCGSTGTPFNLATTLYAGNNYSTPVIYMTPALCVSAYNGVVLNADAAVNSTFSEAIVGATALTFLNCGYIFGAQGMGVNTASQSGFAMLWQ